MEFKARALLENQVATLTENSDPPIYDYASRSFNTAALERIAGHRADGTFPAGYRFISETLVESIDPVTGNPAVDIDIELHRSQLFMAVAAQANEGSGLSSLVIRNYHQYQSTLRNGDQFKDSEMQEASNAVARSIFDSIGSLMDMPNIDSIATNDAINVGQTLFPELFDQSPDSPAWVGIILYPLAGVNQFFRLEGNTDEVTATNFAYAKLSTQLTLNHVQFALSNPLVSPFIPFSFEDFVIADGVMDLWVRMLGDESPQNIDDLINNGRFLEPLLPGVNSPEELIDLSIIEGFAEGFTTGGFEDNQLSGTERTGQLAAGTNYFEVYHGGAGNDDIFGDHETDPNKYGSDLAFGGPGADLLIGGCEMRGHITYFSAAQLMK